MRKSLPFGSAAKRSRWLDAAALALFSCIVSVSSCTSEGCPEGFAKQGPNCEPAQTRSKVSDQAPEQDASVRPDAGESEGSSGAGGEPSKDDQAGAAGSKNEAGGSGSKDQAGGSGSQDRGGGSGGQGSKDEAGGSRSQESGGARAPAPVCTGGGYRCAADTLQRCNSAGSAWESVEVCEPGQCDMDVHACRVCSPGASRCMGTQLMSCNAEGTKSTQSECTAPTAFCQNGACVECVMDIDCAAASCNKRTCTAGKCSAPMPASFGTACTAPDFDKQLPGQCTNEGVCAPIIAIRIAARAAGDGTPINPAYVSANPDGYLKAAGMNGGPPGPWEPFLLIREAAGSSKVQLWSLANQGYVTPVAPGPGADGKPSPEAKWLGSQATEPDTFELSSPEIGKLINIRSISDTHYWSAEDWMTLPADYIVRLRAERSELGPWEQFTLIPFLQ